MGKIQSEKWCQNQIVCEEDKGKGTYTCTAFLADGRCFPCPYNSVEQRAKAEYPCSDYRPEHVGDSNDN